MTKHIGTAGHIGTGFNPLAALVDGVLHTGATLVTWQQRAHERAHLDTLDDRLLRDAGIDPYAAQKEVKKPFWKR